MRSSNSSFPIIYLPKELKKAVNEVIEKYPPEIKPFKKDKIFYFLHLIYEIPAINKRNGLSKGGYTILNSVILRKVVYNYNKYLEYLFEHGIIEIDDKYIPKKRSKGYKIAKQYNGLVSVTAIQNFSLVKCLKKGQNEKREYPSRYEHLFKSLKGLEMDYDAALIFAQELFSYRKAHPNKRQWDSLKNRYKNHYMQYNSAYINIDFMKRKRYNFFADKTVHRLHTNITNMQSDLRNFLTWKGSKLVSIDVSNSQPYLSCKLFSPQFYFKSPNPKDNKECGYVNPNGLTLFSFREIAKEFQEESLKDKSWIKSFFLCFSNLSNSFNDVSTDVMEHFDSPESLPDVKKYMQLVEDGTLYDYLAVEYKKRLLMNITDRKSIKAVIFQVLFTDNRFIGQKEAAPKRIFKELFPNVYKLFFFYKKGNAALLPRLLQQLESRLILDVICRRIIKEKPGIPLITVHDSIATTISNLDYVKGIMTMELTKYIGIKPNLKVEYWDTSNVVDKYPEIFPEKKFKLQA